VRNALGIFGFILAIGGALVAGIYSSDNAACGTSIGVTARSLSQTAQNSCVLYGTLYTLGIVLAVVGIVLLVGWVALLVRLSGQPAAPSSAPAPPPQPRTPGSWAPPAGGPGWYRLGDLDGPLAFWNGQQWERPEG
jgi:hypothetical protein